MHGARILRVDADDGNPVGDRAADDLRRAADAGRLLAIPDGDEEIDIRQHDEAGRLVGARALAGGTVQFENRCRSGKQSFESRTRFRRLEIARVFGASEGQNRFQPKAGRQPRFGDDAVRTFRHRGNDCELARRGRRLTVGIIALDVVRSIDDRRENAVEERAQWRRGFGRQFGRDAMPADTDAHANAGRKWKEVSAHGRPTSYG